MWIIVGSGTIFEAIADFSSNWKIENCFFLARYHPNLYKYIILEKLMIYLNKYGDLSQKVGE
jgi:hypothetical protein